jgi:L-ascorbate metabolism protein UlaG (beta-lactamase superfamily)
MTVTITAHGHSTYSVHVNDTHLLIDPFFSGNPAAKITPDGLNPDYILITHGHGDHVGDAVSIARRSGATVISNFEIVGWFAAQGHEKGHAQHLGGGFTHPFGHVKLTVAFHGSQLPDGSYGGMPAGFLLTLEGKRIYIAGDTALYSDMALIGAAGLDVAILPVGDNFTMGPDDSVLATNFLNPEVVIPCHYNTWPPIAVDIDAWSAAIKEKCAATPVVLNAEESFVL